MDVIDFINHLLNLLLPALCLATLLVLLHRIALRRYSANMPWWKQWLYLFAIGAGVLVAGLVVWQRDGKMLTYIALALAMGATQAWMLRGKPRRK